MNPTLYIPSKPWSTISELDIPSSASKGVKYSRTVERPAYIFRLRLSGKPK